MGRKESNLKPRRGLGFTNILAPDSLRGYQAPLWRDRGGPLRFTAAVGNRARLNELFSRFERLIFSNAVGIAERLQPRPNRRDQILKLYL